MKKIKCPKCETENPEGSKYCSNCGGQLQSEPEPKSGKKEESKPEPKYKAEEPKSKKPEKTPKRGISNKSLILILVVVVAIVGVAAFLTYSGIFTAASPQNSTVFIDSAVSGSAEVIDPVTNNTYTITVDYYGLGGGSGFIVSKDGYIVTAAHVVSDPYDLENKDKIRKMNDDDIKWYVDKAAVSYFLQQYYPDVYANMTESDLEDMTDDFITSGSVHATNYEHNIYIRGPAFPDSVEDPPVARIVDSGDSGTEIDIALLKVDNISNLPVIPLNSQKIEVGSEVRIYGYPTEQFEFYSGISEKGQEKEVWESMFTSTLTTGIVSGERTSPKGIKYYQTDAAVDHGSSGGPVCNANNQVIGIIVLGFEKQGFNFFLPSEYIVEMCKKNGVNI